MPGPADVTCGHHLRTSPAPVTKQHIWLPSAGRAAAPHELTPPSARGQKRGLCLGVASCRSEGRLPKHPCPASHKRMSHRCSSGRFFWNTPRAGSCLGLLLHVRFEGGALPSGSPREPPAPCTRGGLCRKLLLSRLRICSPFGLRLPSSGNCEGYISVVHNRAVYGVSLQRPQGSEAGRRF